MYVHVFPPPGTRYAAIQRYLADLGEPRYRFAQLVRALLDRGAVTFEEMTELPRGLRAELTRAFGLPAPALRPLVTQSAPQVEKALFATGAGRPS